MHNVDDYLSRTAPEYKQLAAQCPYSITIVYDILYIIYDQDVEYS